MQVLESIYLLHLGFFFSILRWVNRKDPSGTNIFGGGFLGLDNIGKDTCSIHLSE